MNKVKSLFALLLACVIACATTQSPPAHDAGKLGAVVNPNEFYTPAIASALATFAAQSEKTARLATTGALPSNTYGTNTTFGTECLTASSNAALAVDGVNVAVNDKILVLYESPASHNGLYLVMQTGSGSLPYVLRRDPSMFNTADFVSGAAIGTGSEGLHNANSFFVLNVATAGGAFVLDTNNVTFLPVGMNNLVEPSVYKARGVGTANLSLASFPCVTGGSSVNCDGVVFAQGDIALLTVQTTVTQNGPYTVGIVSAGSAPLTRPGWWQSGSTQPVGQMITVGGEGTHFKNSTWKSLKASTTLVVDTNDPVFYPQFDYVTTSAATAGVAPTQTGLYVFSAIAGTTNITPTPVVAGGTQGIWRISTQTAGLPGSSSVVATSSSGTDTSTVKEVVQNW